MFHQHFDKIPPGVWKMGLTNLPQYSIKSMDNLSF